MFMFTFLSELNYFFYHVECIMLALFKVSSSFSCIYLVWIFILKHRIAKEIPVYIMLLSQVNDLTPFVCLTRTIVLFLTCQGNCDIAELLMKSAERIGIRLDRYVNREGKFDIIGLLFQYLLKQFMVVFRLFGCSSCSQIWTY